mgnify:FL=1
MCSIESSQNGVDGVRIEWVELGCSGWSQDRVGGVRI